MTLVIGIWFKIAVLQVSLSVGMGLCEAEGHMLLALWNPYAVCSATFGLSYLCVCVCVRERERERERECVCVCVCDVSSHRGCCLRPSFSPLHLGGSLHFLQRDSFKSMGRAGPSESCAVGSTTLRAAPLGQCSLYSHLRQCVSGGGARRSLLSKPVPLTLFTNSKHRNS